MKKFLSLVLALVMTMSLVTVSAGAVDFTDDSDIDYEEAVDVISALGIVDGYSDDSFRPDGSLTRGAAAKIICNLILGPTTASALSATTAPFKDVPTTNTFAGYITYCAQQGIIGGYGDGTFRPSGTLTGNAFMKMLLGALGYDSSIEGYSGANWQVNVIKQAVGIGLDDGNDNFVGSQAVTRQEAALYAFNMIQANLVQYDSKTTVNVNGATVTVAGDKAENIPQAGSGYDNTMNDSEKVVQFAEKHFPKLTKTAADHDAFGRPANEWKYGSEIIGKYTDYSDMIASYDGVKAEKGDLYDVVGSSIVKNLAGTANSDGEYKLSFWVDGQEYTTLGGRASGNPNAAAEKAKANFFDRNSTAAAGVKAAVGRGDNVGVSGNGVLTQVFMDDDNNVTITMINTYLVKATADYNANRETLTIETVELDETNSPAPNLPASISNEDHDVADYKEGDYILVTVSLEDTTPSIESVEPAEVVTGTVSEFTAKTNAVIGGTKYSYNKLVGETESSVEYTIDADASVVLDSYGYILYVDEAVSTSSYVYIQEAGAAVGVGSRTAANAFFADGTNDSIILKKVLGSSTTSDLRNAGGWYTYIKGSDDRYSLSKVTSGQTTTNGAAVNTAAGAMAAYTAAGQKVITNSQVSFLDGESVKANANTVFVLWDAKNDTYVYQGIANAPTVNVGADGEGEILVNWVVKNGYATYVFIDASDDGDAKIDDVNNVADYLFILKSTRNKTVVGEDTYYQYEVLFDGEQTTKYIEESIIDVNDAQGDMVYNVKANDKEYITSATPFEDHNDGGSKGKHEVTAMTIANEDTLTQSGRTLTITGKLPTAGTSANREYLVDDETVINLVVGEDCILLRDSGAKYELYQNLTASGVAGLVKGYQLTGTVYAVTDDDNSDVLDYLYVFVDAAKEVDTSVIPTLTRTDNNSTTVSDGAQAPKLDFKVSVNNRGTLTYTVNNGTSDIKDDVVIPTGTNTFSFYPTDDGDVGTVEAGTYTVTVTNTVDGVAYDSNTVTVTVGTTPTVSSIAIATMPNKLNGYQVGDTLDTTGLTVTANMSSGDPQTIQAADLDCDVDFSTFDPVKTVTVTYQEKTATFQVAMSARASQVLVDKQIAVTGVTATAGVENANVATYTVSATNGGSVTTTTSITKDGGATDNNLTATISGDQLVIATTASVSAGEYVITVSGTCEDNSTPAGSATITVTVAGA